MIATFAKFTRRSGDFHTVFLGRFQDEKTAREALKQHRKRARLTHVKGELFFPDDAEANKLLREWKKLRKA